MSRKKAPWPWIQQSTLSVKGMRKFSLNSLDSDVLDGMEVYVNRLWIKNLDGSSSPGPTIRLTFLNKDMKGVGYDNWNDKPRQTFELTQSQAFRFATEILENIQIKECDASTTK